MRALLYDGQVRFVTDAPSPQAGSDEALIRIRVAGICNTDLELTRGYKDFVGIPGHEFVGEVCDAPDSQWIGQRVCGDINRGCGRCSLCAAGRPAHCRQRRVLGILGHAGAFAEYVVLPTRNLHPVPPQLRDDEAVFVEPLAAACRIVHQVRIEARDRVIVLGDGKLGILCAQVLSMTGCDPLVLGRHPHKLELLRRRGIAVALTGEEESLEADIVVEATGSRNGLQSAIRLVRPQGTIILKSTTAGSQELQLADIAVKEIRVVGSRCGPFPEALEALLHHHVDVLPLISDRFPLAEGERAFRRAAERDSLKVLIDI